MVSCKADVNESAIWFVSELSQRLYKSGKLVASALKSSYERETQPIARGLLDSRVTVEMTMEWSEIFGSVSTV